MYVIRLVWAEPHSVSECLGCAYITCNQIPLALKYRAYFWGFLNFCYICCWLHHFMTSRNISVNIMMLNRHRGCMRYVVVYDDIVVRNEVDQV